MEESEICNLCYHIRDLEYFSEHQDEEMIFSYIVKGYGNVYKYYRDHEYSDVVRCPKCGRKL